MEYAAITIATSTAGIDPLTGRLMNIGITGFEIEDANDFQEFLSSTTPHWDYVEESLMSRLDEETTVKVYLPVNEQGARQMEALRYELDALRALDTEHVFGRLVFTEERVNEADWENNWKQYFRPFPVGRRFLIRPVWENPDPQGRTVLTLDPGCAFGSGQHHTTQLCLEFLEDVVRPGDSVLDMGCGSGILSVAAGLLGARDVFAVDIDENAVRMTRENWAFNPVTCPLDTRWGNVLGSAGDPQDGASDGVREEDPEQLRAELRGQKYDVVVANIVADVLIAMAPLFGEWLTPDGTLLVSGIYLPRVGDVLSVLHEHGYAVAELREQGEWASARLRRFFPSSR